MTPFEIDASRSGLPPAGTIFTSFIRIYAEASSDNLSPMSEILPARLTEPVLPFNCSTVVMLAAADNVIDESRDDRQDHHEVGAAKARVDDVGRRSDDDVEIAGDQRLHRRRPGAEKDRLDD